MSKQNIYWRVNEKIHALMVRVIDEKGKQLGVLSTAEALKKAREAELDLVEIAPKAIPPVAKIIEFGKFRYSQQKKLRAQKSKSKSPKLKEIRFSPFIGNADYKTRLGRVKEFLSDKDKVRLVVKFKGRQMGSKQYGYGLLDKIVADVGKESISVDMQPKFLGRHLVMVISPLVKSRRAGEQESRKNTIK